jgi:diacylglycerol kinase (CTP)
MNLFKKRSDIHWARKIWHMLGVSVMALLYALLPYSVCLVLLGITWLLFVPFDFARQKNPKLNEKLIAWFKPIMREHEVDRPAGTSFLLTGVALVVLIFPKEIVLLTLLFLAFADPIASYFGIRFGRDKILGNKSLQGTGAAFFVCATITALFLLKNDLLVERVIMVSVLGGVIGALSELIPIGQIDDNLTLPVLSSVFLYVLFSAFGVYPWPGV